MIRRALTIVLLAWAAASAGAQPFSVLLNNPEEADFHFVLDPPELASFDPFSSVFASVVGDYFAETPATATRFTPLPAGGTVRLEPLTEGAHLVVGFFALPGRRELPVRVLNVKAGGGLAERFYSIYTEPSLVKARAGKGRLAAFGPAEAAAPLTAAKQPERAVPAISIDNRYQDWEAVPALRSFTGYEPASFTREQYGAGLRVLPLGQAKYWQKAGTALGELKAIENGTNLYFFLSTSSAIAEGLSAFLYFQDPKDPEGENRVTVELVPAAAGKEGLAVLWEKDRSPLPAGTLASGSFFLEAALSAATLYSALVSRPEFVSFDLTTCYFDRNSLSYEEFYFATVALKDIPKY